MSTQTILDEVVLVTETCCKCGTVFAMEQSLNKDRHKTGDSFYCPNGHSMIYRDTAAEKIKKMEKALEAERSNAQWWRKEAEAKARSLAATKGVLTRTKNRIHNGVCPCCNRSFENLERHMKNQHPNYAIDQVQE